MFQLDAYASGSYAFFTVIYIRENVAENMCQLLLCFFCQIDSNVKSCRRKSSAALRRQLRTAAGSVEVEKVFVTQIPPDADHKNVSVGSVSYTHLTLPTKRIV